MLSQSPYFSCLLLSHLILILASDCKSQALERWRWERRRGRKRGRRGRRIAAGSLLSGPICLGALWSTPAIALYVQTGFFHDDLIMKFCLFALERAVWSFLYFSHPSFSLVEPSWSIRFCSESVCDQSRADWCLGQTVLLPASDRSRVRVSDTSIFLYRLIVNNIAATLSFDGV